MSIHEKHMALIDAVNNSKTRHEHWTHECTLWGWKQGIEDAGKEVDRCRADLEQIARGHGDRPMCCGVFNDWKEQQ